MIRLLRIELYKIFHRPRTYISFAITAAIAFVIQLAMLADGKSFVGFALQGVSEQFDIKGNVLNGYLITYLILQTLLIHIPLLVALVAGDALAGEANIGTLRLLLTKPVTRPQLVLIKFTASVVYAMLLLLWLAVVALGLSVLLFGTGDMISLKSDAFVMLLKDDVLWRYFAAFAFAGLAMMCVASLALLLSVFADNSIGPIISTMGIIIVLTIFSTLQLPIFDTISPYLFTTHMIGWKGFFDSPVPYTSITHSAVILLIYTFAFVATAIIVFNKKDIQS
ncbi:MAG: ABC transporter permease subunit [Bacteroidetes bacterium]|nr:ABC transporter permease subunit [Bacteroidota bacterium]